MIKNSLSPFPSSCLPAVSARPRHQRGLAVLSLLPNVLLQGAAAFLAMEFVPHYGDVLADLYGRITQGLNFALNRI